MVPLASVLSAHQEIILNYFDSRRNRFVRIVTADSIDLFSDLRRGRRTAGGWLVQGDPLTTHQLPALGSRLLNLTH